MWMSYHQVMGEYRLLLSGARIAEDLIVQLQIHCGAVLILAWGLGAQDQT